MPRKKEDKLEIIAEAASTKVGSTISNVKKKVRKVAPKRNCSGNPKYALEKRLQAKAIYISSGGRESDEAIAEAVGTTHSIVQDWKLQENWARELPEYQKEVKETILMKLRNTKRGTYNRALIKSKSDDELLEVVKSLVGPTVTTLVGNFLAQKHREDLKDLDRLNRAVRKCLLRSEKREVNLTPKDIFSLVGSKVNIIKGTRLILGQSTENNENTIKEEGSVSITLTPEAMNSLQGLLEDKSVEAEFKVIENIGKTDEGK